MCNAMRRNENHFGRVTFLPRAPPPKPPTASCVYTLYTLCTTTPRRPSPTTIRASSRRPVPPRGVLAQRYETRPAAPPRPRLGLGDATVTPVGRRPTTRRPCARGEGWALGIRRLDVIDPNRTRGPCPATDTAQAYVRAGTTTCTSVTAFFTARFALLADDDEIWPPTVFHVVARNTRNRIIFRIRRSYTRCRPRFRGEIVVGGPVEARCY